MDGKNPNVVPCLGIPRLYMPGTARRGTRTKHWSPPQTAATVCRLRPPIGACIQVGICAVPQGVRSPLPVGRPHGVPVIRPIGSQPGDCVARQLHQPEIGIFIPPGYCQGRFVWRERHLAVVPSFRERFDPPAFPVHPDQSALPFKRTGSVRQHAVFRGGKCTDLPSHYREGFPCNLITIHVKLLRHHEPVALEQDVTLGGPACAGLKPAAPLDQELHLAPAQRSQVDSGTSTVFNFNEKTAAIRQEVRTP